MSERTSEAITPSLGRSAAFTNEAQAAAAAANLKFPRLSLFCGSENYTSRQDATRRHSCSSNKKGNVLERHCRWNRKASRRPWTLYEEVLDDLRIQDP